MLESFIVFSDMCCRKGKYEIDSNTLLFVTKSLYFFVDA